MVDDPPLPLTNLESLTSAQQQRLASLHGVASLRSAGSPYSCPEAPAPLLWVRAWLNVPSMWSQGSRPPLATSTLS